jgi:iron complex transport system ATP-binding protein
MNDQQAGASKATIVLEARGVTVRRGPRAVLRDVNLTIRAGEVAAIIGPNGAGKSTLLSAFAGLRGLVHDEGTVRLFGDDLTALTKPQIAARLAFLPAQWGVPFPLTVRELMLLAEPTELAYSAALEVMELKNLEHQPVTQLSTGEAKRAWIAMTLARRTPLMLLDEPLAGLDPRYQVRLLESFKDRANEGHSVVFIAHDIPYAARADRVIALGDRRVMADGAPLAVLQAQLLRELYGVEVWLGTDPETGAVVPLPTRAI